ncbi:hypothetical protein CDAR_264381 [Caerostris darwini]|uniref:Uncharacterized protein n=1 Tax=Caerostris darwini TaxID=1538125 RepID=A0AAV4Q1Z6_9ARAC|nr:hypothetical protein CDAR_264381 [Caerostris darwini]
MKRKRYPRMPEESIARGTLQTIGIIGEGEVPFATTDSNVRSPLQTVGFSQTRQKRGLLEVGGGGGPGMEIITLQWVSYVGSEVTTSIWIIMGGRVVDGVQGWILHRVGVFE